MTPAGEASCCGLWTARQQGREGLSEHTDRVRGLGAEDATGKRPRDLLVLVRRRELESPTTLL
eukprot:10303932-Lingulodinium_polyedra.AAC.1